MQKQYHPCCYQVAYATLILSMCLLFRLTGGASGTLLLSLPLLIYFLSLFVELYFIIWMDMANVRP